MGWRAAHGPPGCWGCVVNPGGRGLWVPSAGHNQLRPRCTKQPTLATQKEPNHSCCEEQLELHPRHRGPLLSLCFSGKGWRIWVCYTWLPLGPAIPEQGRAVSLRSPYSSHWNATSERCSLTISLYFLAPGFVFLPLALSYDYLVNVGPSIRL